MGHSTKSKRRHHSRRSTTRRSRSKSSSPSRSWPPRNGDPDPSHELDELRCELNLLRQVVSTSTRSNIKLDEAVIPLFEPSTENNQSGADWVNKIDELIAFHNCDQTTAFKLATTGLRGNAQKWYDSLPNPCLDWQEMKEALVQSFPTPIRFGKPLVEAANYNLAIGQNLSDYCFEKTAKLRQLRLAIPEEYVIDSIIEGIKDEKIALPARAASFKSVGTLANYLSNVSPTTLSSEKPTETVTDRSNSSYHLTHGKTFSKPFYKINKNARASPRAPYRITCYNCHENHRATDCPKPNIECTNCHKLGHTREKCWVSRPKTNNKQVNEIRAVKASPNVFLKTAVINNKKIKCLLDTGSDCTIMKLSVTRKVKAVIHESETNTTLRCFLGNVIASSQKCEVEIEIEEAIVSVTAIVLEDQYLRHDIIIGRDYLCNEDVLLTKTRDKLSLRSLPPFDIGNIESEDNAPSCLKLETINFAK
ncbi:hypothetical protein MTP99_003844 [Tenebrio molitor]|jgi:hypothetical protein|nr:hypothetical protein MTP99_003844 [Tenebrio molitor]